jgi:hypothetical protein
MASMPILFDKQRETTSPRSGFTWTARINGLRRGPAVLGPRMFDLIIMRCLIQRASFLEALLHAFKHGRTERPTLSTALQQKLLVRGQRRCRFEEIG